MHALFDALRVAFLLCRASFRAQLEYRTSFLLGALAHLLITSGELLTLWFLLQRFPSIGGWNFEPWRGPFYPGGLPQARELAYAAERLTAIEINSTFYSNQKPATFAKWRDQTPEGFMFTVKCAKDRPARSAPRRTAGSMTSAM